MTPKPIERTPSVNIRPGVAVLSVLRHLNYKPWFAFAEFVDNSLQSFLTHRVEIQKVDGRDTRLRVSIEIDPDSDGRITIRDNAAGISAADYPRAFRPAEIPADRRGLSEFGMGMKSAACWFAPTWHVRTSALGEAVERTVRFDIDEIVRDEIEELTVQEQVAPVNTHFTEIVLESPYHRPQGRTLGKIRDHLAGIYRVFIRRGELELLFGRDALTYTTPKVLDAAYYRTPGGPVIHWEKPIAFDFGLGLRASGFAALREKANVSESGFALFRRDRLIVGSADEGYRPELIFGKSNSYRYQRLFGELNLEGFNVSHTKDGFAWEDHEEAFLQLLKEALDTEPMKLLDQAEGVRMRPSRGDLKTSAQAATESTAAVLEDNAGPVLEDLGKRSPASEPPSEPNLPKTPLLAHREIFLDVRGEAWKIVIELTDDPAIGEWIELWDARQTQPRESRTVGLKMSVVHPFSQRFGGTQGSALEPLVRLAAGIALAEVLARRAGVKNSGTIRRNLNELLRGALSAP